MSRKPEPWPSLLRRIERIEEWMSREGASSKFAGTPLRPQEDGSMAVDARLSVTTGEVQSGDFQTGSKGWHLGADGRAEFKDVTLYDIPNSMLASPVTPGAVNATSTNFSLGTTFAEKAAHVVTVPAGYTRLLAMASGWVYARNPNTTGGVDGAGTDAMWCYVQVGGASSQTHGVGISGDNGFATASSGLATVQEGLTPGSTIRLGLWAGVSIQALPANTENKATLSALLVWLR